MALSMACLIERLLNVVHATSSQASGRYEALSGGRLGPNVADLRKDFIRTWTSASPEVMRGS
jgi:hypothetical protein